MSQTYRLGLVRARDPTDAVDTRWPVVMFDSAAPMLTGGLVASDGSLVPYRLWPAAIPRALVLLLHGALDYSAAFDELGPRFSRRGITALAIDQRGFGATASRGDWSGRERMIRDVIEAALFLRMRYGYDMPLFVVGESMGAALAVHCAARAPDLELSGLVLAAPGAVWSTWRRIIGGCVTWFLRHCIPASSITIERTSAWEFTPASAIRLLGDPTVLRRIRPATLFGLFKLARGAVDAAEQVRIPVLAMAGGKDDVLHLRCIGRLYERLAGEKTWAFFADAPHLLLHWKDHDRILERVFEWIDTRLMRMIKLGSGQVRTLRIERLNRLADRQSRLHIN
jgi:alpha-beta hydrolase superfamily lysophospholipase